MVMRVQLQAAHLWDVIEYGADDDQDDRAALAALLRSVPPELVRVLGTKDCARSAWETLKTMRLGCKRIREAKAQTRQREFEELRFRASESVENFAIRLTSIVSDLELLGDPVDEYKAVLKYLRVVPKKYRPMVMAIEQTVKLRELTIEDLTGRLIVAEEGYDLDDAADGVKKLLLMEEEWAARRKGHQAHRQAQTTERQRRQWIGRMAKGCLSVLRQGWPLGQGVPQGQAGSRAARRGRELGTRRGGGGTGAASDPDVCAGRDQHRRATCGVPERGEGDTRTLSRRAVVPGHGRLQSYDR
jgi:hypothetical protein